MEFILTLDGISVGAKNKRERGFTSVMSFPTPNQHKMWRHRGHVFVCNGFLAINSRQQQTQEGCVWQASLHEELLQFIHVGQGPLLQCIDEITLI